MKILYHHRTQAADGQAVHIVALQEAFQRAGHELHEVALVSHAARETSGASRRSPRWKRLLWAVMSHLPRFLIEPLEYGYNLLATRTLMRELKAFRPDFIYERYALGNWAGVKAARRSGIPIVLEVNSPMVREMKATRGIVFEGLARRVERSIFRRADLIAVVTEELARILIADGAPAERIFVTPNGIGPRRRATAEQRSTMRSRWGVSDDEVVLGFVGFYRDWHRLDRVVRAIVALPGARFVAVGEGPGRAPTEALARELGVGERVSFPGRVTASEVPAAVAAFDVALIPAINAYASPLKLFDYLAGGKAVLAPDQANLREVLEHDRNALLFDPAREESFAEQLLRLVGDAELRTRLGSAGRDLIEERGFTWDANVARILVALDSHVGGR